MSPLSVTVALALVFIVALGLALGLTPVAAAIGRRLDVVDRPRRGEVQVRPVARTGGYAIFLAFFGGLLVSLAVLARYPDEYPRLLGLALGALIMLPVAVVDDLKRLSPLPQLVAQIAMAAVAFLFGVRIEHVANPAGGVLAVPAWLVAPVTVFWIVGMINTVNFIDTMDGLAAGIGAIGAAVLFAVAFQLGQHSIAALPAALAGACLGFLVYNFHPARVFMGTAGSMFIGYALAVLAIIGGAKIAATAMVLGVPIVDVALVIVTRIARGRSPFAGGDGAHLPHRLLRLGLSQRQVAGLLYVLCLTFGLLAIVLVRAQKLVAFGVMGVVLIALLSFVAVRSRSLGPARQPLPEHGQGELRQR